MSRERSRGSISPEPYVSETTSSSSSEGADQNALSSSSDSPSLTAALRNFDIGSSSIRELVTDAPGSPDDDSVHAESYMEYSSLLSHRQAQEPTGSTGTSTAGVAAVESLSLLTNTTNSLSFGLMSSVNDENGDRTADDSSRSNEAENNNDISSGSSAQVNDFDDVELSLVSRDMYSPSANDPGNSGERREDAQSESFVMSPSIHIPHLMQLDLANSNETNSAQGSNDSSRDSVYRGLNSSTQPLKLPSSTRLKITVLKWNVAASWKWTAGDETCGICRMPFEACCIECKTPGDECPLALGACKHAFHMHCIVKWTETQNTARPQCPLCRQEWKFAPG